MSLYKITLHRSPIGLPQKTHRVIKALGLKKTTQNVAFKPVEPVWAGMILKAKEILKVEVVDEGYVERQKIEQKERRDRMKGWVKVGDARAQV